MAADPPRKAAGGAARRPLSLKARALALLAQREHSEAELRRKLLPHAKAAQRADPGSGGVGPHNPGFDVAAPAAEGAGDACASIDEIIEWLRAHRYLDDQRFVESRLHARASRYGNLRIRQELAQHGLDLPEDTAQALKASEFDRAHEVWRHKFAAAPADAAEYARQARFLAQRGFSAEVVSKLLRRLRRQEPEEDSDMPTEG